MAAVPSKDSENSQSRECAICQDAIGASQTTMRLGGCAHEFHARCISPWLATNSTCPMCRGAVEDVAPPEPAMTHRQLDDDVQVHPGPESEIETWIDDGPPYSVRTALTESLREMSHIVRQRLAAMRGKRILILGRRGTGRSTFAGAIAARARSHCIVQNTGMIRSSSHFDQFDHITFDDCGGQVYDAISRDYSHRGDKTIVRIALDNCTVTDYIGYCHQDFLFVSQETTSIFTAQAKWRQFCVSGRQNARFRPHVDIPPRSVMGNTMGVFYAFYKRGDGQWVMSLVHSSYMAGDESSSSNDGNDDAASATAAVRDVTSALTAANLSSDGEDATGDMGGVD